MFCKFCGKEIDENSKFCPHCGKQLLGETRKQTINDNEILFTAKPVFIPIVTIISFIPIQLFMTVWGSVFFGVFGVFAIKALKLNIPVYYSFIIFGFIFFLGIPFLVYFVKKRTYEKTEYRFYKTKMEYYEGFFNLEEKTIQYKNITEVYLRRGIIQKQFNLGTIYLATPATGMTTSRARSGIAIMDIENPEDVYKKVKELINL